MSTLRGNGVEEEQGWIGFKAAMVSCQIGFKTYIGVQEGRR